MGTNRIRCWFVCRSGKSSFELLCEVIENGTIVELPPLRRGTDNTEACSTNAGAVRVVLTHRGLDRDITVVPHGID